jgi:hypothetical protein
MARPCVKPRRPEGSSVRSGQSIARVLAPPGRGWRQDQAGADVLPYDYEDYGKEIAIYVNAAQNKAKDRFGDKSPDFSAAVDGARHLQQAGAKMLEKHVLAHSVPCLEESSAQGCAVAFPVER